MRTKREKELQERGYEFSGFYSRDRDEAKKEAARERANGNFAAILVKLYKGRGIYNTEGFSVYVKKRNENTSKH